jgi:hypothetical protein
VLFALALLKAWQPRLLLASEGLGHSPNLVLELLHVGRALDVDVDVDDGGYSGSGREDHSGDDSGGDDDHGGGGGGFGVGATWFQPWKPRVWDQLVASHSRDVEARVASVARGWT